MPPEFHALVRLFPVLDEFEGCAADGDSAAPPDARELRRCGSAAMRELLTRLAARGPLVLFIDDVQWGDIDSALLAAELLRPPAVPGLLLIAAYRAEDVGSSPFIRSFLSLQGSSPGIDLPVPELSRDETEALASELGGDIPKAAAEEITRESRGNPYLITELVQYARMSGAHQGDGYTDGAAEDRVLHAGNGRGAAVRPARSGDSTAGIDFAR